MAHTMEVFASSDFIQGSTIADGVYDRLREAIVSGQLRPGTRLVEANLAQSLQVSRTPLREAFRRLERERLVERVPNGGVRVPAITAAELEHLADIRRALEGMAVRRASARVRDNTLAAGERDIFGTMERLLEAMPRSIDTEPLDEFLRLGREFHQCIYRLSGNPWCGHIMHQVLDALERYRARTPSRRHRVAIDEHRAIMDAIRAGDETLSETLMHRHLDQVRQLHRHNVLE